MTGSQEVAMDECSVQSLELGIAAFHCLTWIMGPACFSGAKSTSQRNGQIGKLPNRSGGGEMHHHCH